MFYEMLTGELPMGPLRPAVAKGAESISASTRLCSGSLEKEPADAFKKPAT
jgi:hypothetical protein